MSVRNWVVLAVLTAGCASGGSSAEEVAGAESCLKLTDMQGRCHDLEAGLARGETVALVFWQTWCKSCRKEAPELARAVRDHGEKIRFVGVVPGRDDTVDDGEVRKTAAEWGYDAFPQVRDRDLALTRSLKVKGTPTILVLGKGKEELFRAHRAPKSWETLEGVIVAAAPTNSADCKDGVCPLPEANE
jgi:thiol-disulfide isomerase/thioredoxin